MAEAAPAFVPKRKKLLTRPVLKFVTDEPRYILLQGRIYLGKEMKQRGEEKKKEPAHLCDVVDLSTGELAQIIVNAVPMSVLKESYPNNGYVGCSFSITRQSRQNGKSYDPFKVEEIETPPNLAKEVAEAKATEAKLVEEEKKATEAEKAPEADAAKVSEPSKGGKK